MTLLYFFISFKSIAQGYPSDTNGLKVIKDVKIYEQVALKDSLTAMIDLKKHIPGLLFDLRYASKNNFTRRKLYPRITTTYLRWPAAKALAFIQKMLYDRGLGLKIFDAYRPYAVTKKMWKMIKDERYVADPGKGSGHNRGIAIDLTVIDLTTGHELNMGTGFDNFSDTAHHDFIRLPPLILYNRKVLKEIMEQQGFTPLATEWWHYSYARGNAFPVLDIGFRKLRRVVK